MAFFLFVCFLGGGVKCSNNLIFDLVMMMTICSHVMYVQKSKLS